MTAHGRNSYTCNAGRFSVIDDSEVLDTDKLEKTPEKTKLRELLSKVKKIVTFFRQSERATTELLLLQKDLPEVKRLR